MRKQFLSFFTLLLCLPFLALAQEKSDENKVNDLLDAWHKAAAEADFEGYFEPMAQDAIYIGTDPTENWDLKSFKAFAKPYFEKGKAWEFTPLERNLYFSENKNIVWFDELLNTWMGICRGSGVLTKESDGWKIKHYVLSMTVPNEQVEAVQRLKQKSDKKLLGEF